MNVHAKIAKRERQAAAYVMLALEVIPLAKSAGDLRAWWSDETRRRAQYGLTKAHTQVLVDASRAHVLCLDESRGVRS
jgi:hypothetical protein